MLELNVYCIQFDSIVQNQHVYLQYSHSILLPMTFNIGNWLKQLSASRARVFKVNYINLQFVLIYQLVQKLKQMKQSLRGSSITGRETRNNKLSIDEAQLFLKNKTINYQRLLEFMKEEGRVELSLAIRIMKEAMQIFSTFSQNQREKQSNMVKVNDPIVIIGDLHGQYYDLLQILEINDPASNNLLFLGDYVDRGKYSVQICLLLMAMKINWKQQVIILRGNHESRNQTEIYGFRNECLSKYNQQFYEMMMEVFDCLPLAALLNQTILCMHGGLSPTLQNINQINKINRFQEIPEKGIFCDLMWSDPTSNQEGKLIDNQMFIDNAMRGCSVYFGSKAIKEFFQENQLIGLIRAHEPHSEGYNLAHWLGENIFPSVITIFSAPNYCNYNNKGAYIKLINNQIEIVQLFKLQEPYTLPGNIHLFQFSLHMILHQITGLVKNIIPFQSNKVMSNQSPDQIEKQKKIKTFLRENLQLWKKSGKMSSLLSQKLQN